MGMWDDVTIGTGTPDNGAVKLRDVGEATISSNARSYWIDNAYLSGGMTIFKDTPEGAALKNMLSDESVDNASIAYWLADVFITNVTNGKLQCLVRSAIQRAEREARRKKAKDINKAFRRAFEKIDEY